MVPYPVMYNPDPCWKVCRACIAIGLEEKKGLIHALQSASVQRPVHDVIMFLGRGHIVDVLGIILPAYSFPHAYELPCVYGSHKFDESSIKMELFLITQTEEKRWLYLELKKIRITQP